ncbi:transcriptional regulator, TetR family protein [Roseobacter sp. AzwK-3b]|uniref:transcriptional regulator BetI n=1 Tax=Roseobacter sp. AzwK-3b TaxID=351016 RepID=UPI0001569208|nr:transcriptional regulator BetI [Roseobacter sp. AzwK-3b]EDM72074.1 transcriptional regulator, TetR family protein [Roseobacter sp. AzwK-3b]
MRSRSIRTIRRAELSKAAFEAVVLYGLRGTTLEKVGEIAGVSKGVVLHHFKDKSSLLEAVIRRTNGMLSTSLVELYRHAETPYERLWAIIIANFHESIFNQAVCQAWVSLMAEVPHNRSCQRVQIANYARVSSNFSHELKHFVTRDEAKIIARQLNLLIDGIWVRVGSRVEPLDSDRAIGDLEYFLMRFLPMDEESIQKHRAAREKIENVARIALGTRAFLETAMAR